MSNKARSRGQFKDEKFSEDLNYTKLLWLQIDRILKAITEENDACIIGVDALEIVLAHLHDKEYMDQLNDIQDWYEKTLKRSERFGKIDTDTLDKIDFIKSKKKFRELIKLMDRVGLYPKKDVSYSEV